jgi:dipeptidyl aminopeptidase/acylaminoacyl peptidase
MEPALRRWSRPRWIAKLAVLAVLGGTPASYLGVSVIAADILTRGSNRPHTLDAHLVGADARIWTAVTADGVRLRGWYFPTSKRQRLVVLVHGMHGTWEEVAALGSDLHRLDYAILLFDLRGHGRSDPSRLFMGRRERADIRAVLDWAQREGYSPDRIGWVGYSMGAATVLMEGAQNPSIRAAVLDSPYGNLPELLDRQLTDHSHLPRVFNPGILLAARWVYGVRTDDLVPIRHASRWGGRALLLIHGEADTIVPVHQSRLLARAAGPACSTVTLPGVDHVEAYSRHRQDYVAAVDQFFTKNLAH